jgi:putative intracellular protease/amidase
MRHPESLYASQQKEPAMHQIKILMVVTSASSMGEGGKPTGVWFEELATPYYTFIDAGAEVTIASITGGEIPIDPNSVMPWSQSEKAVDRFLADPFASKKLKHAARLSEIDVRRYDAVFLPGGHGTSEGERGNWPSAGRGAAHHKLYRR